MVLVASALCYVRSRRCFRGGPSGPFAHRNGTRTSIIAEMMTRPSSLIVASLSCLFCNTHVDAFSSSRSLLLLLRRRRGVLSPAATRTSALWSGTQEDEDDEEATNFFGSDADSQYQPPKHTSSFLEHLESVRSSWPDTDGSSKEGVDCTGEPSVDPSRTIQAAETDDSNWM